MKKQNKNDNMNRYEDKMRGKESEAKKKAINAEQCEINDKKTIAKKKLQAQQMVSNGNTWQQTTENGEEKT